MYKAGAKKRIISGLLSLCITLTLLMSNAVIPARAQTEAVYLNSVLQTEEYTEIDSTESAKQTAEAFVLYEMTDKREENVKHYKMSDGSYIAVTYAKPIHFQTENGWQEIDNTLVAKRINGTTRLVNSANKYSVSFSNGTDKELFQYNDENIGIAFGILSDNALVKAPTVSNSETKTDAASADLKAKSQQILSQLNTNVSYLNVLDNVDVIYSVSSTQIKESIVLRKKTATADISFEVKLNNGSLQLTENGSIAVLDSQGKSTQLSIPSPYLEDAAGVRLDAQYSLTKTSNSTWTLEVLFDKAWLEQKDRIYPVIIDPTLETAKTNVNVVEAYLNNGKLKRNLTEFSVSGNTENTVNSYILFDMPEIPEGAAVTNALAVLPITERENVIEDLKISAHEITENSNIFDFSSTTPDYPRHNSVPLDYADVETIDYSNSSNLRLEFDITEYVASIIDGTAVNYGLVFKAIGTQSVEFFNTSMSYPTLAVTYRDTSGIEDYYTYTSMSAGEGGNIAVNNATGNVTATLPLIGNSGERLSVSLSAVFNTNSNGEIFQCCNMGADVMLNYDLCITETAHPTDSDKTLYAFVDGDGTKHHFYEDSEGKYRDENNLGYILKKLDSGYEIKSADGILLEFNSNGYLVKITQNADTVTVTRNNNCITRITDAAGVTYDFVYSDEKLYSITDSYGKNVVFAYEGNPSRLKTITYLKDQPGSTATQLNRTFGSSYHILSISNRDGTYTYFTLSSHTLKAISLSLCAEEQAQINTSYSFDYHPNRTDITDLQGRVISYQFDNSGKTVSITDNTSGMIQFYRYGSYAVNSENSSSGDTNRVTSVSNVHQSVTNLLINQSMEENSEYILYNTDGSQLDFVSDTKRTGSYSCKLTCNASSSSTPNVAYQIINTDVGTYTASIYIGTNGSTLSEYGGKVGLATVTASGSVIDYAYSEGVTYTDVGEWARISVTYTYNPAELSNYNSNNTYYLAFMFGLPNRFPSGTATVYFDDAQLEYGNSLSSANLLKETGFKTFGLWSHSTGISISTSEKYNPKNNSVKISGSVTGTKTLTSYPVKINAQQGDTISFGAIAKAPSVSLTPKTNATTATNIPTYCLELLLYNNNSSLSPSHWTAVKTVPLAYNPYYDSWQFVTSEFVADTYYSHAALSFRYDYNCGTAYFTMPFIYLDEGDITTSYEYDNNGNLSYSKKNGVSYTYTYNADNNILRKTSPTGTSVFTSYMGTTSIPELTVSTEGQATEITYNGNLPTEFDIGIWENVTSVDTSKTYYIRNAETGYAMRVVNSNGNYVPICSNLNMQNGDTEFSLVHISESLYKIKTVTASGIAYLHIPDNSMTGNLEIVANENEASSFVLSVLDSKDGKLTFGTYGMAATFMGIASKGEYTYSASDGTEIVARRMIFGSIQSNTEFDVREVTWYLYSTDGFEEKLHSETEYDSTANNNRVLSETNTSGNTVEYSYYSSADGYKNSLLKSITDGTGASVSYSYDAFLQLSSITAKSAGCTALATVEYSYTNSGLLEYIDRAYSDSTKSRYRFTYDFWGRTVKVEIGNGTSYKALASYEYNASNAHSLNLVTKVTYPNGDYVNYWYDALDRLQKKSYNNGEYYQYMYDSRGNLYRVVAYYADGEVSTYTYNYGSDGLLKDCSEASGANFNKTVKYRTTVSYDENKRVNGYRDRIIGMGTFTTGIVYGAAENNEMTDAVYKIRKGSSDAVSYTYDSLGRLTEKALNNATNRKTVYSYRNSDNGLTTTQISGIRNYFSSESYGDDYYGYTYDERGNISHAWATYSAYTTYNVYYTYDALGQLTREDNQLINATVVYTYDNRGNLQTKKTYPYTRGSLGTAQSSISYTYSNSINRDLLTKYNGISISYDSGYNPISWYDGSNFTWANGRRLVGIGDNISYTYNNEGLRTSKTVNGVTTEFIWSGSTLLGGKTDSGWIYFYCDANGIPYGFRAGNRSGSADFYYQYNLQGDVVAILNASGNFLCRYAYDSWGKPLGVFDYNGNEITDQTHIGYINPIRYRGYLYDAETGFYYLQSRYYDPEVGRFLNLDSVMQTGIVSSNMFAYCNNNPIMYVDSTGEIPVETVFDIISLGTSIVGVAVNPTNPWEWIALLGDIADVAIPYVGGLGEAIKVLKAVDAIDDTVDVTKITENTLKLISATASAASVGHDSYVYFSYINDQSGILEYVGITNNFDRREMEWRKVRKIQSHMPAVDRKTARIAEQTTITLFGRKCKNGANTLSNIRNSIGVNGKYYDDFIDFIKKFF